MRYRKLDDKELANRLPSCLGAWRLTWKPYSLVFKSRIKHAPLRSLMAIDFPLGSKSKLVIALPYNEFSEEILLGGNSRKTQKIIIDKKLLKKLQFPISQWAGHDVFLSDCTRRQSFSSLDLMLKR